MRGPAPIVSMSRPRGWREARLGAEQSRLLARVERERSDPLEGRRAPAHLAERRACAVDATSARDAGREAARRVARAIAGAPDDIDARAEAREPEESACAIAAAARETPGPRRETPAR